jgi:hypothetical protein
MGPENLFAIFLLMSKVILRGSAGFLAAYEEAEYAAWSAPGESQVDIYRGVSICRKTCDSCYFS